MQIQDSVVFITGSAVRVGKTTALTLANKGARVILHYNSAEERAKQTADEIENNTGYKPLIVQGNIRKQSDWLKMRENILQHHKKIDVLINNAAIFYRTPFLKAGEDDWDAFMETNLKSVFLGSQIFGEIMVRQRKGKIINIADVSGYTIWPDYIPYCISKAGVLALTRGLAKALAPHVQVNAIAPGTILLAEDHDPEEEGYLLKKTPLKRIGAPQDIANTVSFLIEGSDFITGEIVNVDGGRSLV